MGTLKHPCRRANDYLPLRQFEPIRKIKNLHILSPKYTLYTHKNKCVYCSLVDNTQGLEAI